MHADSHIGRTWIGIPARWVSDTSRRTHASREDAHRGAGRPGAQDARKGRPYYGRGLVSLARVLRKTDVSMHKGDGTRALVGTSRRTHARGVPTMDGDWVRDIIFRVPQCQIGLMVGDWDGAGCWRALIHPNQAIPHVEFAGNTRNPPTPGIVYADFTRHTRNPPTPGIVYADFTRHTR